jgi:hypothetical protein
MLFPVERIKGHEYDECGHQLVIHSLAPSLSLCVLASCLIIIKIQFQHLKHRNSAVHSDMHSLIHRQPA